MNHTSQDIINENLEHRKALASRATARCYAAHSRAQARAATNLRKPQRGVRPSAVGGDDDQRRTFPPPRRRWQAVSLYTTPHLRQGGDAVSQVRHHTAVGASHTEYSEKLADARPRRLTPAIPRNALPLHDTHPADSRR